MAGAEKTGRSPAAARLDQESLIAIYDETQPLILGYIARRVGDPETARDLTADVYQRLLQVNAAGRGPGRSASAWLYRTAHNIVIDHYRRQSHRQHEPLTEDAGWVAQSPLSTLDMKIRADLVRKALAQLTPDQQQVISLRFLEGLTLAEVSDIVGKPVGAVKSLQHRGLASLQRILEQQKDLYEQSV